MAGHNKWSKVKRIKAVADGKRSKVWQRITREIMVAARDGGGDAGMNAKLAAALERARAENMPKDNMQRAIKRGTGEIAGADYEELNYEGYAPFGIAVFVETLTDNPVRTVADVRHAFSKHGGNMGTTGSVGYLFDHKGVIEVPLTAIDYDALFELVVDAGADDLEEDAESYTISTPVEAFGAVQQALSQAGIKPAEANLERIPTTTNKLKPEEVTKVLKLIDMLEENDDVQAVYHTLELDDETLEALG
ncbi:MAG: YebC/PmpR family DNA-binding transcriptional regulator [Bacteroidetes Order II. Incertae sedis bacterium]|nr:YebC/PmpR family DNA-binding transcriptional regulator [Bacteroidetes Order II. bacterium]